MLHGAFIDFDAYAAELTAIHEQYKNSWYRPAAPVTAAPAYANAARPFAGTPHDYAALLRALLESRAAPPELTPEQREALEAWNNAFPELQMTEEEFLGRQVRRSGGGNRRGSGRARVEEHLQWPARGGELRRGYAVRYRA